MQSAIAGLAGAVNAPLADSTIAATTGTKNPADALPFSKLFQSAIGSVQGLEDQAAQTVGGLLRGDGVDIHTAMIATQKADMAFELALSVRNKAVAAYQSMLSMQF